MTEVTVVACGFWGILVLSLGWAIGFGAGMWAMSKDWEDWERQENLQRRYGQCPPNWDLGLWREFVKEQENIKRIKVN